MQFLMMRFFGIGSFWKLIHSGTDICIFQKYVIVFHDNLAAKRDIKNFRYPNIVEKWKNIFIWPVGILVGCYPLKYIPWDHRSPKGRSGHRHRAIAYVASSPNVFGGVLGQKWKMSSENFWAKKGVYRVYKFFARG